MSQWMTIFPRQQFSDDISQTWDLGSVFPHRMLKPAAVAMAAEFAAFRKVQSD